MGNRGVISTTNKDIALYLHWDGDITFVKGLLLFSMVQGARNPVHGGSGWCRMAQHYNNYVGCGRVGAVIEPYDRLCDSAEWNNGTYIIDGDWNVVERIGGPSDEQEPTVEDIMDVVYELDRSAPVSERIPMDFYMDALKGGRPGTSYEEIAVCRAKKLPWNEIEDLFRPSSVDDRSVSFRRLP